MCIELLLQTPPPNIFFVISGGIFCVRKTHKKFQPYHPENSFWYWFFLPKLCKLYSSSCDNSIVQKAKKDHTLPQALSKEKNYSSAKYLHKYYNKCSKYLFGPQKHLSKKTHQKKNQQQQNHASFQSKLDSFSVVFCQQICR